jgi:hypothetical protein
MDDDNFDLSSLPSSVSLSSTYTPKSAEESPLDSPFSISPIQSPQPQLQEPLPQKEKEEEEEEEELVSPKDKEKHIWVPVDDKWKKILMSDFYFVKDCAPDGNCQFRSLEEAIKSDSQIKASHKKLRKMVAEHILTLSDIQFQDILNNYKVEKDSGEFYGDWDPNAIKTKRQLALEIKKPGFNFEGDNVTLSILSKVLNLDIFIFNQNTHTITKIENDNTQFIIINFIQSGNTGHYRTIGFKLLKDIQTLFNRDNLPEDMLPLVDKQLFYSKHIKLIYELYDPFTCNDLISNIELLLGKLTPSDKKIVCKISAQVVTKEKPKPREKIKSRRTGPKSVKQSVKKSKSRKSVKKSKSRKSVKKSKSRKSVKKSKSKKSVKKSKSKKSVKKSKSKKSVKKSKSRKSVKKSNSVKRKSKKSKSKRPKSVKRSKLKSVKKSKSRKSVKKSKSKKSVKKSKSRKSVKKSNNIKRKSKKSKSKRPKSVKLSKLKSVKKSKSKKSVKKSKSKSRKSVKKSKSVNRKSKKSKKSKKLKRKIKRAKKPKRKSRLS